MTGPHTAAAEIAKITAMITHDHQSLSLDCVADALLVLAFTWRAFGMVHLFVVALLGELAHCAGQYLTRNARAAIKIAAARSSSTLRTAAFFAVCSG
jgi:hypothetical protein